MSQSGGSRKLRLLSWASLALLCHVALGATNASTTPIARQPVEFSPTVSLFFLEDVLPFLADPTSNLCIEQVKRASAFNAKRLNYVITWYFVDDDRDSVPERYCYRPSHDTLCVPFTQDAIATWELGLQSCIKYAIDLGFDIFYTPHVNDGGAGGGWRNAIKVDPLARHGGFTYKEILLDPISRIISRTARGGMKFWFSMQGEMNLAVMTYPQSYSSVMRSVRADVLAGRPDSFISLYTGVSFNFNKLLGLNYLDSPSQAAALLNVSAIVALLNQLEFIGFSNYPSVGDLNNFELLESALSALSREMNHLGVSLAQLTTTRQLICAEYGYGGGVSINGDRPATTAGEVGQYSYYGVFGPYNRSTDPWHTWQSEATNVPARTAVRQLYNMTARYLATGGHTAFRVDGLFLWGCASWDLLGVHHGSYSKAGSYREPGVVAIVRGHNAAVSSARGEAPATMVPSSAPLWTIALSPTPVSVVSAGPAPAAPTALFYSPQPVLVGAAVGAQQPVSFAASANNGSTVESGVAVLGSVAVATTSNSAGQQAVGGAAMWMAVVLLLQALL